MVTRFTTMPAKFGMIPMIQGIADALKYASGIVSIPSPVAMTLWIAK